MEPLDFQYVSHLIDAHVTPCNKPFAKASKAATAAWRLLQSVTMMASHGLSYAWNFVLRPHLTRARLCPPVRTQAHLCPPVPMHLCPPVLTCARLCPLGPRTPGPCKLHAMGPHSDMYARRERFSDRGSSFTQCPTAFSYKIKGGHPCMHACELWPLLYIYIYWTECRFVWTVSSSL